MGFDTLCECVLHWTELNLNRFISGCAHNNSDSEYMAGQLAAYGYNLTSDKTIADLWLLNSCTVKNPSEDTFRNEIQNGLNDGKHVVGSYQATNSPIHLKFAFPAESVSNLNYQRQRLT